MDLLHHHHRRHRHHHCNHFSRLLPSPRQQNHDDHHHTLAMIMITPTFTKVAILRAHFVAACVKESTWDCTSSQVSTSAGLEPPSSAERYLMIMMMAAIYIGGRHIVLGIQQYVPRNP